MVSQHVKFSLSISTALLIGQSFPSINIDFDVDVDANNKRNSLTSTCHEHSLLMDWTEYYLQNAH